MRPAYRPSLCPTSEGLRLANVKRETTASKPGARGGKVRHTNFFWVKSRPEFFSPNPHCIFLSPFPDRNIGDTVSDAASSSCLQIRLVKPAHLHYPTIHLAGNCSRAPADQLRCVVNVSIRTPPYRRQGHLAHVQGPLAPLRVGGILVTHAWRGSWRGTSLASPFCCT